MDENINNLQETKISNQLTGIGALLKSARESLHLNEKDVAARLNLHTRMIHMMENEAFDAGLPLTFARGYLRSYARLLNLNETEVNAALGQFNASFTPAATAVLPPVFKRSGNQIDRYLRWLSYFIISFLLVLVLVWWTSHPRYNESEVDTKKITADASDTNVVLPANNPSMTAPALTLAPHVPVTPTATTPAPAAQPTTAETSPAKPLNVAASKKPDAAQDDDAADAADDADPEEIY